MATETHETVGTPTAAVHETPKLLQFDPGIGIWTLVAFVLLLILLKRYAWKPIIDSIDERARKLKESLAAADRINEEARLQSEKQKAILVESQEQAALIIAAAHKSADVLKEQIIETAQGEKARIVRNAYEEVESFTNQAKTELRKFSAELAVNTAEKILVDQLDREKATIFADKMVKEFNP